MSRASFHDWLGQLADEEAAQLNLLRVGGSNLSKNLIVDSHILLADLLQAKET